VEGLGRTPRGFPAEGVGGCLRRGVGILKSKVFI
jgi:hypothetical protein